MRSILIGLNGQLYSAVLPLKLRGGFYQMPEQAISPARVVAEWANPEVMKIRTFVWRGQIVRPNGTELVDFFEEVG